MNFSVLMSLYYKENPKYLDECLVSIQTQSLQANEVVIVFDGELTAELEEVVQKWMNKLPIRVVRLTENLGLGKALNQGLEICSYEWIIRMDTDDICVSDRFEKQIAYITENSDIDVCGGQITEFRNSINEENLQIRQVPLQHQEICQYAKSRNPINHMTVAYKKSSVLTSGSYQHALYYEDYDLWVRMLAKGCLFANLPDTLVYARAGNAMYQRRGGWQYVKSELSMQQSFLSLGFINQFEALKNLMIRIPVRLMPEKLRGWVYDMLLRR